MKYLFADLEFANSIGNISKICEFGYVITNEKFEVIQKDNIIINPNISRSEWDYKVVRKILTRKISEYEKKLIFSYHYEEIKKIILSANYVFGHTFDSDAKALNDDCKRYELESIDYDFYDVKVFYKESQEIDKSLKLYDMLEKFNIQVEGIKHDAESDAYNTMLVLKEILKRLNIDLEELIKLYPNAKNGNSNFELKSVTDEWNRKIQEFEANFCGDGTNIIIDNSINKRRYSQFLNNVKPQGTFGSKFKNKKISISHNYEDYHYKQALNLIQLVSNEGGQIFNKISEIDIYVSYNLLNEEGKLQQDPRLEIANEINQAGAKIQIMTFEEFLNILGITEEELDDMPLVSFDFLLSDAAVIKDKKDKAIIERIKAKRNLEKKPLDEKMIVSKMQ